MTRPTRQWKAGQPAPPQGFTLQSNNEITYHSSVREPGVRISLRRERGQFVVALVRRGYETMREDLDTEIMGRKRFEWLVEVHEEAAR